MFLKHGPSQNLVEVLALQELWDPNITTVEGRFHAGEELQDPEEFSKAHLRFPSGEALPVCWLNPNYQVPGESRPIKQASLV
ncbi:acetyltransferase [filamentous cyanobacterium CCP5]|nr:acetyltransferase [filamentous cyanobacterium CCP5]